MPAPQLHLSFGASLADHADVRPALRRACKSEPVYVRLGSIFHDLPYYGSQFGSMVVEAVRYGLGGVALDEPWAYRMHSIEPARFVASFVRAAATCDAPLTMNERLALVGGLMSHCALDLTLHPLVNFCARRDVAELGGYESVHHRQAEKYQALFFHLERHGRDPIGTADFRRWTKIVKEGSFVHAQAEPALLAVVRDAYRGAYDGAPSAATWCGWVRSFQHFGVLVGHRLAARNSERAQRDPALRERYFENATFRFFDFYACSERRLAELANLSYDYFEAGQFSGAAEASFRSALRIDDLAEPTPQIADRLPSLPSRTIAARPRLSGVRAPAREVHA